jgi:hypothetical protein
MTAEHCRRCFLQRDRHEFLGNAPMIMERFAVVYAQPLQSL